MSTVHVTQPIQRKTMGLNGSHLNSLSILRLLLQEGKPVAYALRALSDGEIRYIQIEKELLAVVFAFIKFHQYVYGKDVVVESDNKQLEIITKKVLVAIPPQL